VDATPDFNELQRILIYTEDSARRAWAHLHLGRMAIDAGRRERAIRHLNEALHLDATNERARALLLGLQQKAPQAKSWLRGVSGFFRK
jgi:Flp pilus assembly protein TadD